MNVNREEFLQVLNSMKEGDSVVVSFSKPEEEKEAKASEVTQEQLGTMLDNLNSDTSMLIHFNDKR